MKFRTECPFCEGHANLEREQKMLTYKGESFKIMQHFYRCELCKEEFTTDVVDELSLRQAWYQYRAKHHIPFPDEITRIREQYGFSANKMSELLGMGTNQYAAYERGDMPIISNANLIRVASNPKSFLDFIEGGEFDTAEVKSKIIRLSQRNVSLLPINMTNEVSELTGFRRPDWRRISNLILNILSNSNARFNSPLKINKILFYIDFQAFRELGRSVTGLTYRAIQWGPVPACYDNIYCRLANEELANQSAVEVGENFVISYLPLKENDMSLFIQEEQMLINSTIQKFSEMPTRSIVNLSHKEKAWKELESTKSIINYAQYAYSLIGV